MVIITRHTRGMPEVDYQPQDDHYKRREVEPVRLVVLERTQEKSERKKRHVNARRGKGLSMQVRHNLALNQRWGAYRTVDRRSR